MEGETRERVGVFVQREVGEGECVGGEGRSGDLDVGEEGEEEGTPAGGKGQAVV
jgi:hypothetical protein